MDYSLWYVKIEPYQNHNLFLKSVTLNSSWCEGVYSSPDKGDCHLANKTTAGEHNATSKSSQIGSSQPHDKVAPPSSCRPPVFLLAHSVDPCTHSPGTLCITHYSDTDPDTGSYWWHAQTQGEDLYPLYSLVHVLTQHCVCVCEGCTYTTNVTLVTYNNVDLVAVYWDIVESTIQSWLAAAGIVRVHLQ